MRIMTVRPGIGAGPGSSTCAVCAAFGTMVGCVVSNTMRSGNFCSERMRRVVLSTGPALWMPLSATALGEKKSATNSRAIKAPPANTKYRAKGIISVTAPNREPRGPAQSAGYAS